MNRKVISKLQLISRLSLAVFCIWTILIKVVDVKPIGPKDSLVGFSTINSAFHSLTGEHMFLYTLTDWLSLIVIGGMVWLFLIGLTQLIKRKNVFKVDADILETGIYYVTILALYFLFELLKINFRSVLIEGELEASYPSSTTLLVLSVMPTIMIQIQNRIRNEKTAAFLTIFSFFYTIFMVTGRIISGVHWLTDILGGIILSISFVCLYVALYYSIKISKNADRDFVYNRYREIRNNYRKRRRMR